MLPAEGSGLSATRRQDASRGARPACTCAKPGASLSPGSNLAVGVALALQRLLWAWRLAGLALPDPRNCRGWRMPGCRCSRLSWSPTHGPWPEVRGVVLLLAGRQPLEQHTKRATALALNQPPRGGRRPQAELTLGAGRSTGRRREASQASTAAATSRAAPSMCKPTRTSGSSRMYWTAPTRL